MAKVEKTDKEWKNTLTKTQYHVLRKKDTEPPFAGIYHDNHKKGT